MQYGFTIRLKNKILNTFLHSEEQPGNLYVGLFINEGQPDEVPVELAFSELTGYQRAKVTFGNAHDGIIENITSVDFPVAKADWTTDSNKIFAIGIFDSETGDIADSCLIYLPLSESEEVLVGEQFVLNINAIRLQLA